jgi:BolA family transcriptional regulator, general stress-responsive regulator
MPYIGSMHSDLKGPMANEIETRLMAALAPTRLAVINDSASHSGHSGDDGTGESHFTVEIESAAFAGVARLERQRMVNRALGDLPGQKVHALAIKARAPGE